MSKLLEVSSISYSYGDRQVLNGISFSVEVGKVLALLGPNGSGKSTLLKLIAGIINPGKNDSRSQVKVDGQDLLSLSVPERAQRVAYLGAELRGDFPVTAAQAVMMGRICRHPGLLMTENDRDFELTEISMKRTGCWDLRDRWLHTLSGGELQLVTVSRALAQEARVLFLDETLSRMDLHHQGRMIGLLRALAQEGRVIVMVSHDLNLAAECADECLLLRSGEPIASGALASVLTTENISKLYPGKNWEVIRNPISNSPLIVFRSEVQGR